MRTQERSAAGANRPAAIAAPTGDRLPSAPRERKPALAALAVLLVLLGALGATVLVMRAGDRVEAVALTQRVPQGQPVPDSAIKSVMVAEDSDVKYVRWEQRGLLKKYRSATDLVDGTVLVGSMLTKEKGLARGKAVVGLSLKNGQYPPRLEEGDTVSAYRVGNREAPSGGGSDDDQGGTGGSGGSGDGSSADAVLAESARVQTIKKESGGTGYSGDLPVSIVVDKADVAELTAAASNGEVSLVLDSVNGN
ncbi:MULTISPECIES: hypothetical protein [unclassified Streptomyces]|uniref:hypothetical protein n=1 Tax=unclassified Streptomyces TaxID=2593676 RepID=UPI002DD9F2EE|nr:MULTISPECIES: hypothetical protein [unclassified Streptomyces]WSA94605.1 hypothetical protein OIE63_25800 [Streptomyces sp. NBC_01795]WSB79025.1 hypothetical protein OHB04_26920 [Streptomyces sp. NBC_01775]WSS12774.1 hypothetical protein OG533_13310 [Streptomyces sp. NBC_01186]WSS41558.1 hypothetical protein OG220_13845 [Streptomyces sp. NBC_01187]